MTALTSVETGPSHDWEHERGDLMAAVLSQDAEQLNLEWVEADPVSLAFRVAAADWSGTYTAQIRARHKAVGELIGTLTVTAVLDGADTLFTLTLTEAESGEIVSGQYYWDMQQVGGVTRLAGYVSVKQQVTV
jgi:hypothetical protein